MSRAIDSLASAAADRRALRPLRSFSDLEHERGEWQPWPEYNQLSIPEQHESEED